MIAHEEGDIDEEELLLLLHSAKRNTRLAVLPPLQSGDRLCLESLDEETCLRRFRFSREQIYRLCEALDMPAQFVAPCRTAWTILVGLLVLLRRLTYPARLGDLCEEFGRSKPVLSTIFNIMLSGFVKDGVIISQTHFPSHFSTTSRSINIAAVFLRSQVCH